jgi:transposase
MGSWLCTQTGLLAELTRDELADINRLSDAIDALSARIADRVRAVAPTLLALPGCAELTAAKIVSETACVERFKSEAAFARHIGLAPVPHWSGPVNVALKPTRRGNRQLSTAIHRIAVVQIRMDCAGRAYFQRRLAEGDTRPRALRAQTPPVSGGVPVVARRPGVGRTGVADRRQRPGAQLRPAAQPSHLVSS